MLNIIKFIALPLLALSSAAVVSADTPIAILVQNKCTYPSQIFHNINGAPNNFGVRLQPGKSKSFSVPAGWAGRVWARRECNGLSECDATAPATLAEFAFGAFYGLTFYDVSLVDGFNVPMTITPTGDTGPGAPCAPSVCPKLPVCPPANVYKDKNGKVIGCENPDRNTGDTDYARAVKSKCSTVYSFSTDDSATHACKTNTFTITLC
ncbi:thaumatin [Spinellus fusiger]|nr:thaumatin [Spinellus fusiger]